ncbi:hypothetical protein [Egbenema bharatensis]
MNSKVLKQYAASLTQPSSTLQPVLSQQRTSGNTLHNGTELPQLAMHEV